MKKYISAMAALLIVSSICIFASGTPVQQDYPIAFLESFVSQSNDLGMAPNIFSAYKIWGNVFSGDDLGSSDELALSDAAEEGYKVGTVDDLVIHYNNTTMRADKAYFYLTNEIEFSYYSIDLLERAMKFFAAFECGIPKEYTSEEAKHASSVASSIYVILEDTIRSSKLPVPMYNPVKFYDGENGTYSFFSIGRRGIVLQIETY